MVCGKCCKDLHDCACHDITERLAGITKVAMKWCRTCDQHYARCRCAEPVFAIRLGDKFYGMPIK
jgi:hypothetical protein